MEATAIISKYELERGKPAPSKNHAFIQTNLIFLLFLNYKKAFHILSEVTLEFKSGEKSTPDISVYPKLKVNPLVDEISMKEPPLLAIEILSPTQSIQELLDRCPIYFDFGVKSVWIVQPNFEMIHVFSAKETYKTYHKQDLLQDANVEIELNLEEVFDW